MTTLETKWGEPHRASDPIHARVAEVKLTEACDRRFLETFKKGIIR
jgi:hypothetical protein